MATKAKAPTQAQILTQINERLGAIEEAVSTGFVPPAPPPVTLDEFPFWTRPTGPKPTFTLDRKGFLADTTDPDEVRQRAIWCIGPDGTVGHEGAAVDLAWAEVEKLKILAADSRDAFLRYRAHRGGLFNEIAPEVAFWATLTNRLPLWADGRGGIGSQHALRRKSLDEVVAESFGNPDQGASG